MSSPWSVDGALRVLHHTIALTALGLGLPIVDLSCRGKSKHRFKEKEVREFTVLVGISLRDLQLKGPAPLLAVKRCNSLDVVCSLAVAAVLCCQLIRMCLLFTGGLRGAGVRGSDKLGEALQEGARGVAAGAAAVRADAAAHAALHH